MALAGPSLPSGSPGTFPDIWGLMVELWIPEYTDEAYHRFLPLFTHSLGVAQGRFDRLLQIFPDVLPPEFRALLVRAARQLEVERYIYERLPTMDGGGGYFYARFVGVVRALADVDRDADRRRKALVVAP